MFLNICMHARSCLTMFMLRILIAAFSLSWQLSSHAQTTEGQVAELQQGSQANEIDLELSFNTPLVTQADVTLEIIDDASVTENIKIQSARGESPGQIRYTLSFDVAETAKIGTLATIQVTPSADLFLTYDEDEFSFSYKVVEPSGKKEPRSAACNDAVEAGADEPETISIDLGDFEGEAGISWNVFTKKDRIKVYLNDELAHDTGCTRGVGRKNFKVSGGLARVEITPNCDGTSDTKWNFQFECPAKEDEPKESFVYKLADIEATSSIGTVDHKPNTKGYTEKVGNEKIMRTTSVDCSGCPDSIVLGESFNFAVRAQRRSNFRRVSCASNFFKEVEPRFEPQLTLSKGGYGNISGISEPKSVIPTCEDLGVEPYLECTDALKAAIYKEQEKTGGSRVSLCMSDGVPGSDKSYFDRHPKVDYSFDQDLEVNQSYSLKASEETSNGCLKYHYQINSSVSGGEVTDQEESTEFSVCFSNQNVDKNGKVQTIDNVLDESKSLKIYIDRMTLHYELAAIDGAETKSDSITSYQPPPELGEPPLEANPEYTDPPGIDENDDEGDDQNENTGGDANDIDSEPASDESSIEEAGQGNSQESNGSLATTPAHQINPDNPDISALIAQWIAQSEPAVNVQHGHRFKFEQWGRLVGVNVDGGKVSVAQKPDDVGAQSSSKYLWGKRNDLLSANNCSLEEFVMNSLQSKSMAACVGRYGPILPELAGVSATEAKRKLTALKLNIKQTPGEPAPTKQQSMTVQQQMEQAGSELKQGQTVELKLYLPFVPKIEVPNLIGKSSSDAQAKLKKLGLLSSIELGEAAPSKKQAGTVLSQSLAAGVEAKKGTMLSLTVYGPFTSNATIPNVVGMPIAKAKQVIEFAGYQATLKVGQKTDDSSLINSVEKQTPPAGVVLKKGAKVSLFSYAPNTKKSKVGSYVGLSLSSAQQKVVQAGLLAQVSTPEPAPDNSSAGKVHKQTPPPGIEIKSGGRVTLHSYGDFLLTVGDYRRQPGSQIGAQLQADGLKVSISKGEPALSEDLAGSVVSQSPSQGTQVKLGSTISLVVYADYVAKVGLPNLHGLSSAEASQQLRSLGLVPRVQAAGAAPSSNLANSVASTYPSAGTAVAAGGEVTLSVYGQAPREAQPAAASNTRYPPSAGGANSLAGQWNGELTTIDKDTGQVDGVYQLQFAVSQSGSLNGMINFGNGKSAPLNGTAQGDRVDYLAVYKSYSNGENHEFEYQFFGQGSGDTIRGRVEYMLPNVDCVLREGFGALNFDPYNGNQDRQPADFDKCKDVKETQNWVATRVGGGLNQADRQRIEEQLFRANLFRELVVSKQQIDAPNMCGSQRSEAARTKNELVALNQRYQGQATAEYRQQGEALKQQNQVALNQYYACFANNLKRYQFITQASIGNYQQHNQAYNELSQEFGRVGNLDQFITELQQKLR